MKVQIENRPKKEGQSCSSILRLIPETNEDMAAIEWAIAVGKLKDSQLLRCVSYNSVTYAIVLFREEKDSD